MTDTTATAQVAITINSVTIAATLTVDVTELVAALQTLLPAPEASPAGTSIVAPSTAVITDNGGNTWGISATELVVVNGKPDATTANVIELYWDGTLVWQQNKAKLWWSKTTPVSPWEPPGGSAGPAV